MKIFFISLYNNDVLKVLPRLQHVWLLGRQTCLTVGKSDNQKDNGNDCQQH